MVSVVTMTVVKSVSIQLAIKFDLTEKGKRCKRLKLTKHDNGVSSDNDSCEVSVYSISHQIRLSINKWIKAQNKSRLRNLCENKHFSIVVTRVVKQ